MANQASIELRPIRPDDREFLCLLYSSTRQEELAVLPWTPEQKDAFLQMQFNAQHSHYQKHFPKARFSVILRDDVPVGRLYVDASYETVCIIDIALVPKFRNQGIGKRLIESVLADADSAGKTSTLHVERFNRAMRFWQRFGFSVVADLGIYYRMERSFQPARG